MQKINPPFAGEGLAATLLIVILIAFINPTGLLMPESASMMMLVLFALSYFLYISIFWKEQSQDERDQAHALKAGRLSFLLGSLMLIIGISIQGLKHEIDVWLIVTLVLMILTKIAVRMYTRIKQ